MSHHRQKKVQIFENKVVKFDGHDQSKYEVADGVGQGASPLQKGGQQSVDINGSPTKPTRDERNRDRKSNKKRKKYAELYDFILFEIRRSATSLNETESEYVPILGNDLEDKNKTILIQKKPIEEHKVVKQATNKRHILNKKLLNDKKLEVMSFLSYNKFSIIKEEECKSNIEYFQTNDAQKKEITRKKKKARNRNYCNKKKHVMQQKSSENKYSEILRCKG